MSVPWVICSPLKCQAALAEFSCSTLVLQFTMSSMADCNFVSGTYAKGNSYMYVLIILKESPLNERLCSIYSKEASAKRNSYMCLLQFLIVNESIHVISHELPLDTRTWTPKNIGLVSLFSSIHSFFIYICDCTLTQPSCAILQTQRGYGLGVYV